MSTVKPECAIAMGKRSIPTSRPRPGDSVIVTNLDGVFTVESFDGTLFTLRSEHGVQCKAGCLVVRLAKRREAA